MKIGAGFASIALVVVICSFILEYGGVVAFSLRSSSMIRKSRPLQLNAVADAAEVLQHSSAAVDALTSALQQSSFSVADAADQAVSIYSKVDKTGFIGFFATYIEVAIDFFRSKLQSAGVTNAYGYSIIIFTVLGTFQPFYFWLRTSTLHYSHRYYTVSNMHSMQLLYV